MKFTRSRYPVYPGCTGDPCWTFDSRYLWLDVDWNPRFPFGFCAGVCFGPDRAGHLRWGGFTLDVNAPLGEPNRLYLNFSRWHVTLGLLTWHTPEFYKDEDGRDCYREVRCRPYLTGMDRYKYRRTGDRQWERNDKPEPMHWGWLTVERK